MPALVTVAPAAALPVTTAELAIQLGLGAAVSAERQAELAGLLAQACAFLEAQTGIALAAATYRESFSAAHLAENSATLQLSRGPVSAVSRMDYRDSDAVLTTITDGSELSAILPPLADFLPGTLILTEDILELDLHPDRPDALVLTYSAGSPSSCPTALKRGILLLATLWFEERLPVNIGNIVNELPFGLQTLIEHHRVAGWCA